MAKEPITNRKPSADPKIEAIYAGLHHGLQDMLPFEVLEALYDAFKIAGVEWSKYSTKQLEVEIQSDKIGKRFSCKGIYIMEAIYLPETYLDGKKLPAMFAFPDCKGCPIG